MSTFTHQDLNLPVTLPDGLTEKEILGFKPFNDWLSTLNKSLTLQKSNPNHPFHAEPYSLQSITIQSFDRFGKDRLGFVKLTAAIANAAGEKFPGAVFLRGPSVAMLVILSPDDAPDERYAVLTVQPRIAAGALAMVELPAGMVDDGSFIGAAAKEIQEELGLEIREDELTSLSDLARPTDGEEGKGEDLPVAVYPSPGACDERIGIYVHEKTVPRDQLKEWSGKLTGLRDEGEKITLKLVPLKDLWREASRDAKALSAVALWEGLRREGKL